VVLLAPAAALRQTRNYCTVEFRRATDQQLVEVGSVSVHTSMRMDGEPMNGFVTEPKRVAPGRYEVEMVLAMDGNWQITIEWAGTRGNGTATFSAVVR